MSNQCLILAELGLVYSFLVNPPPKIKTCPKLRTAPKIRTTWGFPPSGPKIRTTLDTSKTKAGNSEEFFVHQLLAEIGSDGSLALCCWQVADRIRFRHCLSPCSYHLLNILLHLRHTLWVQAIKNVHFF